MSRPRIEQGWRVTLDGPRALAFARWLAGDGFEVRAEMLYVGPKGGRWFTTDPRVLDWLAAHTGSGRRYPAGWYRDENGDLVEVVEDGPDRCGQVTTRDGEGIVCRTPRPGWRRVKRGPS